MKRRTLLRNLFSSLVTVPMMGAAFRESNFRILVEPADEEHMRRAIRLGGNNPKYPFAALLVDTKRSCRRRGLESFSSQSDVAR